MLAIAPEVGWVALLATAASGCAAGVIVGWWAAGGDFGKLRGGRTGSGESAESAEAEGARESAARLDRRLEEVNRMTGGLAHEIKNPLSTIGLNVQLLREDLAEIAAGQEDRAQSDADALGRVQRRLDGVHRETSRLRDILDDFLRFAGRIRLDLSPVDVDATIEELVDFFTPEAASKGVRLRTDLQAGPGRVVADKNLLKQALLNLLMNAVQALAADGGGKSTPASTIRGELVVRSRPDDAATPAVRLEIIDTGPGIAADRLERVFEPYHTGRRGGTGLGLPTSRRIAELHGGTLRLHSEVGKGSCFTLVLPREGPPTAGEVAQAV